MANERIEEQRKKLKSLLGVIVEDFKLIDEEMERESHSNSSAVRSLKPKTGDYIVHSKKGITCFYTHSDGFTYQIEVHKR